MAKYIIDTNTCIEYFKHRNGVPEKLNSISDVIDDYADIRHALTSQGITVEDFDILIGATARHYGLIAVTDNLKHFNPMPGVEVENWIVRESQD